MQISVFKALFQICLRAFSKSRALPLVPPFLLLGHCLILDCRVPGSCCWYVSNTLSAKFGFLLDCCVVQHFASGFFCLVRGGSLLQCCSPAESRFQAGIKGIFCFGSPSVYQMFLGTASLSLGQMCLCVPESVLFAAGFHSMIVVVT